jgi:predicted Mrr-cat superfamily restriction endonuclease
MQNKIKNYWLFRVSEKWGPRIDDCKKNNLVCCGWNIGLSTKTPQEILQENPWASRMAIKFCYIQEGDIIIMPNHGGIAIGIAKNKQFRGDLDWQDTINVEWLTKWYPRKDLSSKFQTRLKFRGTFLNLGDLKDEIEMLINSEFISIKENYNHKIEQERLNSIKIIAQHLNKRDTIKFQDVEFEKFILELFKLNYSGFEGYKNDQRKEAIDGKDLCLTYVISELDLFVELNIQVKQHTNNASFGGVSQISKSVNEDKNTLSKNILVTSGLVDVPFKTKALEEHNVYVYCSEDIAEMILDNFSEISPKYQQKLNLVNQITIFE